MGRYGIDSHGDHVIEAARLLASEGRQSFTLEDLAVRAWTEWPQKFGMKKHAHPSERRVRNVVFGEKGLVKDNRLQVAGVVDGETLYALPEPVHEPIRLPVRESKPVEPDTRFLRTLLQTVAWQDYVAEGKAEKVTWETALCWWSLACEWTGRRVIETLDAHHDKLLALKASGYSKAAECLELDGKLQELFAKQLDDMKKAKT